MTVLSLLVTTSVTCRWWSLITVTTWGLWWLLEPSMWLSGCGGVPPIAKRGKIPHREGNSLFPDSRWTCDRLKAGYPASTNPPILATTIDVTWKWLDKKFKAIWRREVRPVKFWSYCKKETFYSIEKCLNGSYEWLKKVFQMLSTPCSGIFRRRFLSQF